MNKITLCITMGRRPELLKQTLSSLLSQSVFEHIIAINDFRDEATNKVFKAMCPEGELISLDRQLGHHAAVDHMYQRVKTDWIFHTEDDWSFEKPLDFELLIEVLNAESWMSGICMRQLSDFILTAKDEQKVLYEKYKGLDFYRLDPIHTQWHGYSFNPHLTHKNLWRMVGPFSRFKKERHISRFIRQKGLIMPYWVDGGCSHLGADCSVSYPVQIKKSFIKQWFSL
ncbi:MAG: hypothetical protein RL297_489 [Pseudomonadota bacterium]|jgi:glycosyltransferase involved in cell wall biosynthesis